MPNRNESDMRTWVIRLPNGFRLLIVAGSSKQFSSVVPVAYQPGRKSYYFFEPFHCLRLTIQTEKPFPKLGRAIVRLRKSRADFYGYLVVLNFP